MTDEKIVHEGRQHWSVLACPVIFTVLMLPGSLMARMPFFLIIGVLWFLLAWANRRTLELLVTNKRVVLNTGLIFKNMTDIPLAKIETMTAHKGLLGIGTLTIVGSGGTAARIKNLTDPVAFKQAIQSQTIK